MRAAFSLVSLLILGLAAAWWLTSQQPELTQLQQAEAAATPQPGQPPTKLQSKVANAVQALHGQDAQAQVDAALSNAPAASQ